MPTSEGGPDAPGAQSGAMGFPAKILLFRKPEQQPALPVDLSLPLGVATEPLDQLRPLVEGVLASDMPTQDKIDHVMAVGRCATELMAAIVAYLERAAAAEAVAVRR